MKKISVLSVCFLLFISVLCSCGEPKVDNDAATVAYREYVNEMLIGTASAYYNIVDLDGNGLSELLMASEDGVSVYTYKADKEEKVEKIGKVEYKYFNNAFRSENKKYPGLFIYDSAYEGNSTVNTYYYVTVNDGELVKQSLFEDRTCNYDGEKQALVKYYVDKKLVEVAKEVYEKKARFRWFNPYVISSERSYLPPDFSKDEKYNYNLMLYNDLLHREGFAGTYALYDINGDSVIDLLTLSDETFSIYSLQDDSVKRMYSCSCDEESGSVTVLKNGDILSAYNFGTQQYVYDELDEDFATVKTTSFGYSEIGGETEYTFAAQTVTKEEWDKQTKKYLNAEKAKIQWLPESYEEYKKYIGEDSKAGRDIGPFLTETSEIIKLDGKYYQSSVDEEADVRYVLVHYDEYEMMGKWQWVPIGTIDDYSLDNLGKIE